jgi:hypothetical protein
VWDGESVIVISTVAPYLVSARLTDITGNFLSTSKEPTLTEKHVVASRNFWNTSIYKDMNITKIYSSDLTAKRNMIKMLTSNKKQAVCFIRCLWAILILFGRTNRCVLRQMPLWNDITALKLNSFYRYDSTRTNHHVRVYECKKTFKTFGHVYMCKKDTFQHNHIRPHVFMRVKSHVWCVCLWVSGICSTPQPTDKIRAFCSVPPEDKQVMLETCRDS